MSCEVERRGQEAAELLAAARTGDPAAFDLLVRRYRARVFALALHLTGHSSDADDITQEVFVQAFARIGSFEGRSDFFTWLYRITLHSALNNRRAQRRRPSISLDDERVRVAVTVDAGPDPRRALELRESYAQLVMALDRLSPSLRSTVVLVSLQGLSHAEAAVVLESTEGTIAWRMHQARDQLRQSLASMQKDTAPFKRRSLREYLERLSLQPVMEEIA